MSYTVNMPPVFTVAAAVFSDITGEDASESVTLTLEGCEYLAPGYEPFTIAEAEGAYLAHMCSEISACGIKVADNSFHAFLGIHVFHFGAYGTVHVLAFGHLEGALEAAADCLPRSSFVDVDIAEARAEMLAAGALTEAEALDFDSDDIADRVYQHATMDFTYTESGYLASYEWMVSSESTLEDVLSWAREVSK